MNQETENILNINKSAEFSITRFLRILIHIFWYFSIFAAALFVILLTLKESGGFESGNVKFSVPIIWKVKVHEESGDHLLRFVDDGGKSFSFYEIRGYGNARVNFDGKMDKLVYLNYASVVVLFGIVFFGLFQLRKLFDRLAEGRYFEEINALRIRRLAYCFFAVVALSFIFVLIFNGMYSIEKGSAISYGGNIEMDGIRIGISPIFFAGLCLLTLAEVFREGAKLKSEQDLTI